MKAHPVESQVAECARVVVTIAEIVAPPCTVTLETPFKVAELIVRVGGLANALPTISNDRNRNADTNIFVELTVAIKPTP